MELVGLRRHDGRGWAVPADQVHLAHRGGTKRGTASLTTRKLAVCTPRMLQSAHIAAQAALSAAQGAAFGAKQHTKVT